MIIVLKYQTVIWKVPAQVVLWEILVVIMKIVALVGFVAWIRKIQMMTI